jgi:lactoylglutathione lyase
MTAPPPSFFGPMLIVRDFTASYRFYRELLELPGGGQSPYAEFAGPIGKLVLLDQAFWGAMGGPVATGSAATPRPGVVLAVQVDRVEVVYERLTAMGVTVVSPPTDRPQMGLRNFLLYDPDGNLVEITSPLTR